MKNSRLQYGLSLAVIEKIRHVFSHYSGIEKVVIYGSRAMGRERAGSDIDLTVFGPLSHTQLNRLATELDELMLPYIIDLSLYQSIENTALIDHIQKVGKVFYEK